MALAWVVVVWLIVMVSIGLFRKWFGRKKEGGEK